ncbi:hypothetical protein JD844_011743 [Phrynosoma platyrhinos]|uniref:Uncharacterized protein n=1 Tax=Phrynosoma platyrhinos TaxID=52577 RepID=A0ABQ7TJE2_PHRPL|nr:hypothetical protein JD844_011743 [Phrynosoma platyrhinos]
MMEDAIPLASSKTKVKCNFMQNITAVFWTADPNKSPDKDGYIGDRGSASSLSVLLHIVLILQNVQEKSPLPPGPTPWLFLGNLLQKDVIPLDKSYPKVRSVVGELSPCSQNYSLVHKYGPIFTIWMGLKPAVVLCGYEMVKNALVAHAEEFGGRPPLPILKRVMMGQGFIMQKDAKWRDLRKFTVSTLREFGMGKKTMSERVQEEVLCLVKDITAVIQGKTFDLQKSITNAVSNVMCSVVIGKRFDCQNQIIAGHLCIAEKLISLFQTYLGMVCCSFCVVNLKKTSCELTYNQEDIVMSVFGLFVAGSTTTSDALNFAIFVKARLPHIQAKVQEEINEAIGISCVPRMEDWARMPFTNAVVHEIHQYRKVNNENFACSTTCCTEFRGFAIPQDTVIIPHITSVHFDPLKWETPEEFNPAHFLDEKGQFKKKDAFMPFSAGKRACPGEALARMELFLFFSTLLQNFHFQLVGEATDMDLLSIYDSYRNKILKLPIQATKRLL